MKKAIIISDSFKGSLSSSEINTIFERSLKKFFPYCVLTKIPVADGGEGMVECFKNIFKGEEVEVSSKDPLGRDKISRYFISENNTAFIEMAESSGITLLTPEERNPSITSTYGTGLEIKDAIERGAKRIVLGLGGSATNDGGCGCASALGVMFKDDKGNYFIPTGGTLKNIREIDKTRSDELLRGIEITCMCDVENPMYGGNGAAYVYGRQKGADLKMIKELDSNLKHLSDIMKNELGIDNSRTRGAGAAGAFGAGAIAFLNAILRPGIDTILDIVDFDNHLYGCDCVFTGEGKLDLQSMQGKVVFGVVSHAKRMGIPVVAICGGVEENIEETIFNDSGLNAIVTTNRLPMEYESIKEYSREYYEHTIDNIMALIKLGEKIGK